MTLQFEQPSKLDPVNDRKFHVAGFFYALCHEEPSSAQSYMGGEMQTFTVDHTEPGQFTAPKAYVDKLYPLYNRICDIEAQYEGFELCPVAVQVEWQNLWKEAYPILPPFLREDIDSGFIKATFSKYVGIEDFQTGFDRATARFESYAAKAN